jgi:peptide/nickel transport system permease protein
MAWYVARRVATGVATFIAVTVISFALIFVPGALTIAREVLGNPTYITPQAVQAEAQSLGLLRPLPVQYADWLRGLFTGNLGRSLQNGQSVDSILAIHVPVTLSLVIVSMLLTVVLSLLLGLGAAMRGGLIDRALQLLSVGTLAIPSYWLALVLATVFGVTLRFVPATGYIPITVSFGGWLSSIILPSIAIAVANVAAVGQQLRGAMLDVLRQDYIRTLRSRGISRRAVVLRHALRNAAAPGLTVLSLQVIYTLGGTVIMERIFALPGVGTVAVNSGSQGDVPVVLGVVTFMTVVVVAVNIVVDILNGWLSPKARIR